MSSQRYVSRIRSDTHLHESSVKQAIDERLSDSSAAVRDAAVELIGKYVVQKSSLAAEYYPDLALRVSV